MNTTENNKLIAEFMGMKPINKNEPNGIWNCTIKSHGFNIVQHFSFHSDWNWLMQVVEKIESLDHKNNEQHFQLVSFIHHWLRRKHKELTKIEAVYDACVEFIKWYNEQKSA